MPAQAPGERKAGQSGRGLRSEARNILLQRAEDALIEAGYDDFVAATERGSFHWQTVEHARVEAAEEGG